MNIGDIDYKLPTPKEIKEFLDKRIIGQDMAKIVLSVAIYNHYKRMITNESGSMKMDKSNILMAGPTGCGKTSMIRAVAELLNVPCYIADSTSITQAGYVGDDVESVLVGLLRACDYNVKVAEYGIVVLDEVDKLAKKSSNQNITRDVVGEGVQQSLLKMVEGGIIGVPPQGGRKHPEQELLYMDTTNILFIGLGAFVGLEDIVSKRLESKIIQPKIDFDSIERTVVNCDNYFPYATAEDYKKFGLIPEFIGRFPILTYVDRLSEDDLCDIMTKPENSILEQYKYLFAIDGAELKVTKGALKFIAQYSIKNGTGARGLRSSLEKVLLESMYETPGTNKKEVKIDKRYAENVLLGLDIDCISGMINYAALNGSEKK